MRSPRTTLLGTLLLLPALIQGCSEAPPPPAAGKSVLLITMDTTRADGISCYGGDPRNTPHIDRLAREGVRFENAYSQTNVTNPSHVSILTGQRAYEHGIFSNFIRARKPLRAIQLEFQRAGYRTGAFLSVEHLSEHVEWQGFERMPEVKGRIPGQRVADEVTDEALAWLGEDGERPFFGWVHYFDAHTLYVPPKEYRLQYYPGDPTRVEGPLVAENEYFGADKDPTVARWLTGVRDASFPTAMYNAEIRFADEQIGRLLGALEAAGRLDDTIVLFVADHGESLGEHELYYTHAGLYEVSIRVPLIVRAPGLRAGVVESALVSQLDIAPTLSELFGLDHSAQTYGRSLVPLLAAGAEAGAEPLGGRDTLIYESARNSQVAVRQGRWKLIWSNMTSHRRLPIESQLFDLEADPGETVNLFAEKPDVVKGLRRMIEPWIRLGEIARPGPGDIDPDAAKRLEELGYR